MFRLAATASLTLAATASILALAPAAAPAAASPQLSIGPIRIATREAPLVLPVNANRDADLTLRVNGQAVQDPFTFEGRRLQVAQLSASDGLVPGVNRIRVRALDATATRRVRVPRSALLADAGPDSGATVHTVSRIGAEPAGPTAVPGLRRKWRIIRKPPGANVTLEHRHRAQPLLSAATPGTYVVRLRTRLKGSHRTAYDTVTDPVSPNDPPIGAPINTLGPDGAITISGSSYGGSPDASRLSYAVLERTTRTVVQSGTVGGSVLRDLPELANIAKTYSGHLKYLMIVSGRQIPFGDTGDFLSFLKQLGVPTLTPEQVAALQTAHPFSVIGIPGAAAGAATFRVTLPGGVDESGAITGYLQKNQAVDLANTPVYDYVSPDHPIYDTGAADSATSNTITVGGTSYQISLADSGIPGASAGFHVVILDSQTLETEQNSILVTNSTDPSRDRELQGAVAGFLRDKFLHGGQPIVFLQTIGQPKAAGPEWQGVVDALARLGANRQYVNALDGTTRYAIVGRVDSGVPPAEASTAHADPDTSPPPARLTGILSRDRTSRFVPTVTATPTPGLQRNGGLNSDLIKIAYQQPQPWPPLAGNANVPPDQAAAAEHYICTQLNFCKGTDTSCPDMRSCYWQNYTSDWHQKSVDLGTVQYPGGSGFSFAAFHAVQIELGKEISAVSQVKNWLNQLQEPFVAGASGGVPVDLQAIGTTVYDSVQKPGGRGGAWGLGFGSSIAGVFALASGPVGTVGAGLSAALAFGSYFGDDGGQPILGEDIQAKADQLGQDFLKRIKLARDEIDGLGALLVSDHGKLMAAFGHIDDDWKLPSGYKAVEANMTAAAKQWYYEALVPVGYPYLIRGNADNARALNCQIQGARAFPNQPDDAQMQATVGYDQSGQPIKNVFFFTRGILGAASPPNGLAGPIFTPQIDGGVGVEQLDFFTPQVFNGSITHAVNNTSYCGLRWLPHWP